MEVQLNSPSETEAEIQIHHETGFKLGRVAAQAAALQIVDSQELSDGRRLRIRIDADRPSDTGSSTIDVFSADQDEMPALSVPIHWGPQAVIGFVPQRLDLRQFDLEEPSINHLCRVVALVVPPERRADEIELKTLAPWVSVVKRDCAGSVLRLEIEFARDEMPAEFQQPILSARLTDQPVGDEFVAAGYRSQSQ